MAATGVAFVPMPLIASLPEVSYRKLRPGPGMSPDEVASHQRARIHGAMIEIVSEQGYDAVTVRRLSHLAGVSTRSFYEHFQSKEECLLATHELIVQRATARVAASQRGVHDWRERLRAAFIAFANEIESEPRAARLALLDASAAGPAALERMRSAEVAFEAMIVESFARVPGGTQMPSLLIKGIVSGAAGMARTRLAIHGDGAHLSEFARELFEWTLSLYSSEMTELAELDRRLGSMPFIPEPALATRPKEEGGRSRDDDRPLILAAAAKLAATENYRDLTVPRIRAAAGVSRRSFDAHFENVEDCFLAALELRVATALECAASDATGQGWPEKVCRTMGALCARVAGDPALAALAFVEILAAGPAAMRCREGMTVTIAERFRASAPPAQRPSSAAAETSVSAVWGVIHSSVTSGRAQQLPRIAASLSYLVLAPAIGAPSAIEAIRRQSNVKKHSAEVLD